MSLLRESEERKEERGGENSPKELLPHFDRSTQRRENFFSLSHLFLSPDAI